MKTVLSLLILLLVLAHVALSRWEVWMLEGEALGREHQSLSVAHPGWSFPAHVIARAPLRSLATAQRFIAEAKARGYVDGCATPAPGTYCEKTSKVIARSGEELEPLQLAVLVGPDGELRTHLPLADAPKVLLDAILAAEDRDFRAHRGVNFTSLLRAAFANTREGQYAQGGSTLTMQVVRSLNQRTEKKLERKLREAAEAMGLERALGKDAVLQMYLDAPYLGQQGSLSICGFQEAARHYFSKDAKDLDLAQAATLVAVLPGPGKFAPDRHPDACLARRDRILNELHTRFGYDVTEALKSPLALRPEPPPSERFPSYVHAVRLELEKSLGRNVEYGSGLVVETNLDAVMQQEAETLFPLKSKVYEDLVGHQKSGPLQIAGVALDANTGAVRALYGGLDLQSTGFNRATQSHRQPGSSFKPLVYALAFMKQQPDGTLAYSAASTEPNAPRIFKTAQGPWLPHNVGGESSVTASLAQGLTWSQNIATASLLDELGGAEPLIALAKEVGFDTSNFPRELGIALGQAEVTPLEMAKLAATISNGGTKVEATTILRAVDARGVERISPPAPGPRVLTPEAAALTRDLMRLVIEAGTGGATRGIPGEVGYGGPAMGKTGTTDAEKDLWFIGATPKHAMVVWLGYDQPVRIGAAAADLAAPLWGWWMGHSTRVDGPKYPEFSIEPKVVKQGICTISGLLPAEGCKVIWAPFLPGTQPKAICTLDHASTDAAYAPEAHESLWKRKAREAATADAGVNPQ